MRLTYVLLAVAAFMLAPVAQAAELAQNVSTPTLGPAPGLTPVSTTPAPSDQIASVALQVAQIANDPTMPVDAKTQQINALAAQFNQLVLVWQQQVMTLQTGQPGVGPQTTPSVSTGALVPLATSTPPALATTVSTIATAAPTPGPGSTIPGASASATPGPLVSLTADQLRSQIAAVSQRMTAVSNDPTLSADAKSRQLQDLGTQFNQLVLQLQQTH